MTSALQHAFDLETESLVPVPGREQRTWVVAAVTAVGAALEVTGGVVFHSSGLLGEGLHACGHVGAMVLAGGAYVIARRREGLSDVPGALRIRNQAGLINAGLLLALATLLIFESARQIALHKHAEFFPAIALAAFGLGVNIVCVLLLRPHAGKGADLNFKAVYWHILGDAGVALLAMAGLGIGKLIGWTWPDALAGGLGAVLLLTLGVGIGRRCLRSLQTR